jgi:hypothetical protein
MFDISREEHEYMIRRSLSNELEFISAFIDQQNGQLNNYLKNFNSESKNSNTHGFVYDEDLSSLNISGISASDYNLDDVFKEDLPQYILHSQIILLWAMLERNMTAIVEEIYLIKNRTIPKQKKGDSIFKHLINCLEKIDNNTLAVDTNVKFLEENARYVRNCLVHPNKKIDFTHKWLEIKDKHLIKIKSQYITEVISSINCLGNTI